MLRSLAYLIVEKKTGVNFSLGKNLVTSKKLVTFH